MSIAYNPETGKAVREEGGKWVDTDVAIHPKTGEVAIWDGAKWQIKEAEKPAEAPAPAQKEQAAPEEEPSLLEGALQRTSETAADLLAGAAQGITGVADFALGRGIGGFTPPLDPLSVFRPDVTSVEQLLPPELRPSDMQFSENPTVSKSLQVIGGLGGAGLTSLPTAGARMVGKNVGAVEEVAEGVLGLGAGLRAGIPDSPTAARDALTIDWNNYTDVRSVIDEANDEVIGMKFSDEISDLDDIDFSYGAKEAAVAEDLQLGKIDQEAADAKLEKLAKDKQKEVDAVDQKVADSAANPTDGAIEFGDQHFESVVKHIARRYDMSEQDAMQHVLRNGGTRGDEFDVAPKLSDIRARQLEAEAADLYTTAGKPRGAWEEGAKAGIASALRPATGRLRDLVGRGFSSKASQAFATGNAKRARLMNRWSTKTDEYKAVNEWSDKPEIKRMFEDLFINGFEGRSAILKAARTQLGAKEYEALADLFDDAFDHQRRMQVAFRKDEKLDEVYWRGGNLREGAESDMTKMQREAGQLERESGPVSIGQASDRSRGKAANKTDAQMEQLVSPVESMMARMLEDAEIPELYSSLRMPGNLTKGAGLKEVKEAIIKHSYAASGDIEKSRAAGYLLDSALEGERTRAGRFQRAFMNQAYADALGEFDSAGLNFMDTFITAKRVGPRATAEAVMDLFLRRGGYKTAEDLGIGDAAVGEFREGIASAVDSTILNSPKGAAEWFSGLFGKNANAATWERLTQVYSDKSFRWSLFRASDLANKGIQMRAAAYDMRNLVQKGPEGVKQFREKYGHLFSHREIAEILPALNKGANMDQYTDRQFDILASGLRGYLGQQQVLSTLNRPELYHKKPELRWAYAMTGFAIQQSDLLLDDIGKQMALGNYRKAGEQAVMWGLTLSLGYALTDTVRDLPAYAITGDEKKAPSAENFGKRMVEGIGGPLTLNRLGSGYDLQQFERNPAEFLLESVLPPIGVVGPAGQAGSNLLLGDGEKALPALLSAVPAAGRLLQGMAKETEDRLDLDLDLELDLDLDL